ncbi:MAG TPA: ThuA domain-containing protein [Candidatus Brocadiia bacterium]|nr:ThuA domain-containing protein [Candidatus Brocadiia bacterium]
MKTILVWNEYEHERVHDEVRKVYPQGIHEALADPLRKCGDFTVRTATRLDEEQGLSDANLKGVDAVVWWGHVRHHEVRDELADKVVKLVRETGMGFLPVHSAHMSKPFTRLMGTTGRIGGWREDGEPEHIEVKAPNHPIARGIPAKFSIPQTEMYREPFDIPEPETLIFCSKWDKGEVFRSGCAFTCDKGRVFYWRPGHETYHIFDQDENFRKILVNGVRWVTRMT